MLLPGQFSVRGLVMGRGTRFEMLAGEFNPWAMNVRTPATGERAWNHGSWSGVEWGEERVFPFQLLVGEEGAGEAGWLGAHQQLMGAMKPSHDTVELCFHVGGREYAMYGRPRMVEPDVSTVDSGLVATACAFAALDPLIYESPERSTEPIPLPFDEGGLTVPFTVPLTVDGQVINGSALVSNDGNEETGLHIRIDGPVGEPRVVLQRPDGQVQQLRYLDHLAAGQWLDIDTANRQVLLNGAVSRRGRVTGTFPMLAPGEANTLRWFAGVADDDARMTARWRSAWW